MPPLYTNIAIPVISRTPVRDLAAFRASGKLPVTISRGYDEKPLPVKPSEHAPRNARITSRILEGDRPAYALDIGGIEVDDVGLDEILDYVSAYDLEVFENQQFAEEREVMRLAEIEARAEEERAQERRKARAKTKGNVIYQSTDDEHTGSTSHQPVAEGRHGRARPTYKHMFKPAPEMKRRRRKRDRVTGELIPLSDDGDNVDPAKSSQSDDKDAILSPVARSPVPVAELPRRRRRKRDKATGELLPLSPVQQTVKPPTPTVVQGPIGEEEKKRPGRSRHPQTQESLPLGWRYDPDRDETTPRHNDGGVRSMQKLSIGQEHDQKRLKLTSEASSDDLSVAIPVIQSPSRRKLPMQTSPMQTRPSEGATKQPRSAMTAVQDPQRDSSERSSTQKTSHAAMKTSMLRPVAQASRESSSEPMTLAAFRKMSSRQSDSDTSSTGSPVRDQKPETPMRTSITNPVAAPDAAAATDNPSEEDLDEDEWYVESILGHHISDPRTHPGRKQVMLYKVKWVGFDEPTWEPMDSFADDPTTILAYRKHVGLDQ